MDDDEEAEEIEHDDVVIALMYLKGWFSGRSGTFYDMDDEVSAIENLTYADKVDELISVFEISHAE